MVKHATLDLPDALVESRARELWDQMLHSLSHQGISRETYLQISGREEDDIVEQSKPDAEQALRREAVLAAVIEAEGIEPTEEEILEAVEQAAGSGPGRTSPKKLLERLKSSGRGGVAQGGPRAAQGARPDRRVREADLDRAGAGPRQALDARRLRRRQERLDGPALDPEYLVARPGKLGSGDC